MTDNISKPLMGTVKYNRGKNFRKVLNDSLKVFFKDALRVTLKDPKQAYYFIQTARWQRKAARLRNRYEKEGINVPPILIFSITNRCNLHCKGCYHQALHISSKQPWRPYQSLSAKAAIYFASAIQNRISIKRHKDHTL